MVLVVDNRDSFVYNIVEMLRRCGVVHIVQREEMLTFPLSDEIKAVILSPGAGEPAHYQGMLTLIEMYADKLPMLGVCLGHQALAQSFGLRVEQMLRPLHGHSSRLEIVEPTDPIFEGVERGSLIGRYHSLVVSGVEPSSPMRVLAEDEDGNIMAIGHKSLPVHGVQFHPESIISSGCGETIVKNWLRLAGVLG